MSFRVVVTGTGVISPLGNSTGEFWSGLVQGKCGIGTIDRFDTERFKVHVAGQIRDFDPLVFMEQPEARRMDLYSQYAMGSAVQAAKQAGIDKDAGGERMGVYMGSGIGGIITNGREAERLASGGPNRVSPLLVPMMIANIASGLIAIRYNAKGPVLPVVTACATGTHSVGEAYRAIKHGYADIIFAGGSEAPLMPLALAGFINCMALSLNPDPMTACRPFDKQRDGFIMAEGAGCLVLEELDHALERGADILAEVVGYCNTCDAYHITAPDPEAASSAACIAGCLKEGGIAPEELGYINAHGTSTPLNDKTETQAIKKAMGKAAYKTAISSTKSMTGHMLGAAGAVEAIATVMALKEGILPPTINHNEPDEACDLDYVPNTSRKADILYALSNSLGFGGHNAAVAFKKWQGV